MAQIIKTLRAHPILINGVRAQARATRIEITSRVVVADSMPFGDTGPYEKLRGTIYFEVDPDEVHQFPFAIIEESGFPVAVRRRARRALSGVKGAILGGTGRGEPCVRRPGVGRS